MSAVVIAASAVTAASADEVRLPVDAQTNLAATVYSSGFAFIEDWRRTGLSAGRSRIAFQGVSPRMEPSSAMLWLPAPARALDLTYDFNVLTAEALLRRALGKEVGVVRAHPTSGEETVEPATVLAVGTGSAILRYRDRIETDFPGRLVFTEVPTELRAQPTLVATVETSTPTEAAIGLSYLTQGLDWEADYALEVDEATSHLALTGRARLTNTTGVELKNARLVLVAGDVRRVHRRDVDRAMPMAARMAAAPAPEMEPEPVADLHSYTVPETVTLADQEMRQIGLLSAATVAFTRRYVSESQFNARFGMSGEPRPTHPHVRYTIVNTAAAGLGQPLPAGVARLYTRDRAGSLRFIGEDRIDHTGVGESVMFEPADAFDLSVLRRQTDVMRVGGKDSGIVEMSWEIDVRNAKAEPVVVDVIETMPPDWQVLSESAPHQRETARRAVWQVQVPAGGTARLSYRVRITA
ncbi:MAG: DUF4139 domain-containing protein [Defluviicoccus sp.]